MTGAEIVAGKVVASGLAKVAEEALEDDGSKAQLQRLAEGTPEMEAAARQYAKRIAIQQTVRLKIYQPLARLIGFSRDYFDTQFVEDLAEKTAEIPEEDLVTPKGSVAGPALQGLAYSLDEPDLKEMYLNLLKTASDGRNADDAHPSFGEIIRQLSADEATILLQLLRTEAVALVRVKTDILQPPGGFTIVMEHLMNWSGDFGVGGDDLGPMYVNNWIRLGLVNVTYAEFLNQEILYSWVENRPEYRRICEGYNSEGQRVAFDRGTFRPTAFGRRFLKAVS